ncbi:hypothetical protein [Elioraea sp.]|uniref:hypothetical protein n=1 Tax=Elioraea sp. TaxID=2185103 RepID=UPI0025BCE7B4|nr:hypothetical protein [Elioraea sp.]
MAITFSTPSTGAGTIIDSGGTTATTTVLSAPASMTTGDLDLIFSFIRDSAADRTQTIGTDGGSFTDLQGGNAINGAAAISGDGRVWYKSAAASPGSVTVTHSAAVVRLGLRLRCLGVNLSSPIDVQSGSLASGNQAPSANGDMVVPAITTTQAGCVAVAWMLYTTGFVLGGGEGSRLTCSGWTATGFNHNTNTSASSQITAAVFVKDIAAAGTTGAATFSFSGASDGTNEGWLGGMFALAPDAGGGGGAGARRRVVFFG